MKNTKAKPFGALLYPLIWVFLGPAVLFLTAASIMLSSTGWLSSKDLIFGLLLLATVLGRWSDFSKGDRAQGLGDPATVKCVWDYTTGALMAGVTIWLAAHVIGNGNPLL